MGKNTYTYFNTLSFKNIWTYWFASITMNRNKYLFSSWEKNLPLVYDKYIHYGKYRKRPPLKSPFTQIW